MILLYMFNCLVLTEYYIYKDEVYKNINKNLVYLNIALSIFILLILFYKFYFLFNINI